MNTKWVSLDYGCCPVLFRRFGPCLVDDAGDGRPTRDVMPTTWRQAKNVSEVNSITDKDTAGRCDERVGQGQQDNEDVVSVPPIGSLHAIYTADGEEMH